MDLGIIRRQEYIILDQCDWSQSGCLKTANFKPPSRQNWPLKTLSAYPSLSNQGYKDNITIRGMYSRVSKVVADHGSEFRG